MGSSGWIVKSNSIINLLVFLLILLTIALLGSATIPWVAA